jgi:hypothetical protein
MRRNWLISAAALAAIACSGPTSLESDILRVTAREQALELTNISSRTVYYFAADRHALALIDWAVCTNPDTCPGVPVNSTSSINFSELAGYQPGSGEAVVYHWHLVGAAGHFQPDSIRSQIVSLR